MLHMEKRRQNVKNHQIIIWRKYKKNLSIVLIQTGQKEDWGVKQQSKMIKQWSATLFSVWTNFLFVGLSFYPIRHLAVPNLVISLWPLQTSSQAIGVLDRHFTVQGQMHIKFSRISCHSYTMEYSSWVGEGQELGVYIGCATVYQFRKSTEDFTLKHLIPKISGWAWVISHIPFASYPTWHVGGPLTGTSK